MKANASIALLLAVLIAPPGIRAGESLSEQQVVREVLAANPMLKASAAKWEAIKERVPQAKAWEDPMVGVDFERMGTTRLGTYSDSEWMVSQTLPIAGKNLSRSRAAEAEARVAWENVRRMRLEVTAKARAAYHRLGNAHAQLVINAQNRELVGRVLEIGNVKLSVGKSAQADVLAMETDILKLDVERENLAQALSDQQTALNVEPLNVRLRREHIRLRALADGKFHVPDFEHTSDQPAVLRVDGKLRVRIAEPVIRDPRFRRRFQSHAPHRLPSHARLRLRGPAATEIFSRDRQHLRHHPFRV